MSTDLPAPEPAAGRSAGGSPDAQAQRDAKLRALDEAIRAYEAEFGTITPEQIEARLRADREAAAHVREEGRHRRGQVG